MKGNKPKKFDITLLTDARYVESKPGDWYVENIHLEDKLLRHALENRGLRVHRTNWDNPDFDWEQTHYAMFRTTWDYFDRFAAFSKWLKETASKTLFINDVNLIWWNMDKQYLRELAAKEVPIPPTIFIEMGDERTLYAIASSTNWKEFVLKPAISGSARHTYRFDRENLGGNESIFGQLIKAESMLLQEFQFNVPIKGEITFMMMNGQFTHAVLKKAQAGDFRVQDDFGGTVHDYLPSLEEIAFAEKVLRACPYPPLYARVDAIWNNEGQLCVSELEAIEPELWFRKCPTAVEPLADGILRLFRQSAASR